VPRGLSVAPVSGVEIPLSREPWAYAEGRATEIDEHWRALAARNPTLFNGIVLEARDCRIEDGAFRASAFETSYAAFLYWRSEGYPETGARNLFGSALVRSAEGDLLLGIQADWTMNAGLVYPFGGSLGREDVAEGRVDVLGSIARELAEETGLGLAGARVAPGHLVVLDGPRVSLARAITYPLSTAELVSRVEAFMASEERPELAGLHAVRTADDLLPDRMPPYTHALIRHLFARPD